MVLRHFDNGINLERERSSSPEQGFARPLYLIVENERFARKSVFARSLDPLPDFFFSCESLRIWGSPIFWRIPRFQRLRIGAWRSPIFWRIPILANYYVPIRKTTGKKLYDLSVNLFFFEKIEGLEFVQKLQIRNLTPLLKIRVSKMNQKSLKLKTKSKAFIKDIIL